jgi:hypothetical protein
MSVIPLENFTWQHLKTANQNQRECMGNFTTQTNPEILAYFGL